LHAIASWIDRQFDTGTLAPLLLELDSSLSSRSRLGTAKAASALVQALCRRLEVPSVRVTVRTVRPEVSGGELHRLDTFSKKGAAPTIEVWMKTAARERVVRFFKREPSLIRQLLFRPRPKPQEGARESR
jgi:hypothetical protein